MKNTAARAIASLCEARENRSRFQREGVVDAAISALRSDGLMVEAEAILRQTSTGSYHAVEEVIFKLQAFQGDEMCQKMSTRLWRTFAVTNPEDKRDVVPSMPASKEILEEPWTSEAERSSSSSEGSANEKALRKQIKQDVKIIVSWLQKRCYFPRTYRYRD